MEKPVATTRTVMGLPTGRLAIWWVVGSEIVIFGGLLASYLMHRLGHPEWADQAMHTNTWAGAFNTFVLLTSSLSAVLAHKAAEEGNGPKAAKLLMATVFGGAVFLTVKGFEWTAEIQHGYTISSNLFWSFYYTAAGLHACHIIAGMAIMCWVANQARKNVELGRVELIGLYWHFVDLIWIFLFPLLYIAK
jgi:heme/copper-type cytochrome/quinol oxidase subunit 3